jgi:hypothetical protein
MINTCYGLIKDEYNGKRWKREYGGGEKKRADGMVK